jgi:hypothetical protein
LWNTTTSAEFWNRTGFGPAIDAVV